MMPASRLERFFAFIFDYFMVVILSVGVASVVPYAVLVLYSMLICSIIYYTIALASSWQATPGQRLMQLRVVKLDGRLLTERDALERFLAFYIPFLPIYLSIAPLETLGTISTALMIAWFLPILLRDDHRGMHDLICNTNVLKAPR